MGLPGPGVLDRPVGWTRWPAVLSAVSEVAAGPLRRIAGPDVEVRVLPNGIDPTAWQVDPLPRDPGEVLVVAVMRLAQRKRPLALLRIPRQARARLPPDVRLGVLVIGEGPQRRALTCYLDRHASDWVQPTGRYTRAPIQEVYRRAVQPDSSDHSQRSDSTASGATSDRNSPVAVGAVPAGVPRSYRRSNGDEQSREQDVPTREDEQAARTADQPQQVSLAEHLVRQQDY